MREKEGRDKREFCPFVGRTLVNFNVYGNGSMYLYSIIPLMTDVHVSLNRYLAAEHDSSMSLSDSKDEGPISKHAYRHDSSLFPLGKRHRLFVIEVSAWTILYFCTARRSLSVSLDLPPFLSTLLPLSLSLSLSFYLSHTLTAPSLLPFPHGRGILVRNCREQESCERERRWTVIAGEF